MSDTNQNPTKLDKLKTPLFTDRFFDTFFIAVIGFLASFAPVAWAAANIDVGLKNSAIFADEVINFFWMEFLVSSLYLLAKDALICAVALGTAATINYREYVITDGEPAPVTRSIAAFTLILTVTSLAFLMWIITKDNTSEIVAVQFKKYLWSCYMLVLLTTFGYFLTLIQVRRQIDAKMHVKRQIEAKRQVEAERSQD